MSTIVWPVLKVGISFVFIKRFLLFLVLFSFNQIVGNLICCERCPAAFHEECLEYKFDHEKNFYCQNCLVHKHIHYGEIVWVKLGQYRWWPGRIVHPNQLPDNVSNIKHSDCEFPVYFYGSHDYYWVNKGRTFLYMEDDNKLLTSNSVSKNSSKLIKSFNIGKFNVMLDR